MQLTVDDDTGCVTRDGLIQRIAARLGRDPFVKEAATRLTVTVEPAAREGVRGAVLASSAGSRKLSGPTCESLEESLALSIVLVIDPFRHVEKTPTPAPKKEDPPPPAAPPAPNTTFIVLPGPEPKPAEPVIENVQARVSGVITPATFPTLGAGVELSAFLSAHVWSVGVDVTLLPPMTAAVGQGAVQVGGGWLGLLGCLHVSYVEGCLVARAGLAWFEGMQFAKTSGGPAILGTGGLRLGLVWPKDSTWYGTIAGELGVALKRVQLLDGDSEVWLSPPLNGRATVGLGVRF